MTATRITGDADRIETVSRTVSIGPHVVVATYAALLLGMAQTTVIAGGGAALTPARLLAGGCLLWWLTARAAGHLGLPTGRNPVRTVLLCLPLLLGSAHALALLRGVREPLLASSDRSIALYALAIGTALLACDGIRGARALRCVFAALTLGATASATVALVRFGFGPDLRSLITLPGMDEQDLGFIYLARGGFERSLGLANHPIELAGICAAALPPAIHLARFGNHRMLWRVCAVLLVAGPIVSISRTGLLGLVIVAVALVSRVGWSRWLGSALLAALAGLLLGLFDSRLVDVLRNTVFDMDNDLSIATRLNDYGFVANQVMHHPIAGQGFGTYQAPPQPYLDNQYLFTAVESGLPGVIALLALVGVPLVLMLRIGHGRERRTTAPLPYLTRPYRSGNESRELAWAVGTALLICTSSLGTFDGLSFPQFLGLTFLLVGLAGAVWRTAHEPQSSTSEGPNP